MKKIRSIIILALLAIILVAGIVVVQISNKNLVDDVFKGENIDSSVDDYLISQGFVTAPGSCNAVWLEEDYDVEFNPEAESFISAMKYLEASIFDTVYIRSGYFSKEHDGSSDNQEIQKIKDVASTLRESGKKVYLEIGAEFEVSVFEALEDMLDGFILIGEKNSERISEIKNSIGEKKLIVSFSADSEIEEIENWNFDGAYVYLQDENDAALINSWDSILSAKGVSLSVGLNLDSSMKKKSSPSLALDSLYALSASKSLETRCFSSYKAVRKNYQNSFSSVKKYITDGIVPDITFRELSITGYDGSVIETTALSLEVEICGSNLFPVYLNGEKISLGESGSKKIALELEIGENTFTFSQNGKELTYKVNLTFDGDIIRTVLPSEQISAYPNEKITVVVVAYSKADVTVKIGTKEYKAACEDSTQSGYCAFSAVVKMPSTYEEVSSLGMITVIGTVGEMSVQKKGAMILAAEEVTTTESTTAPENNTITEESTKPGISLGNFVPEIQDDEYAYTTLPTTQAATVYTPYVGNQMCFVSVPYADTRPGIYNDDTYDPSYSTLVAGTVDYVTNEAEIYNEEEGEYYTYYELASGRKVKTDSVQLIPRSNLGSNSLDVLSSYGENGNLTIKLNTAWKVPYEITHTPQNYFYAYNKKYNLSSFSADYIEIVFYHTTAVRGNVDVSSSNVVSSASWIFSAQDETATLRMPLKALGEYYGCTVEYDSNGDLLITVHNKPQGLEGAVILLDAGHGGDDPGALGIGGQVYESDVNIALAYVVRDNLKNMGATVYLTRQGNETLSLDERKNILYSLKPDLFVSIHCNGSTNSEDIGTSVYYYKGFSLKLANNIYSELLSVFKNNLYIGQQSLYSQISDGARYYPFSVLRVEDCPAVLIETGFMTNDSECYKLIQTENIEGLGKAIAEGIAKTIVE